MRRQEEEDRRNQTAGGKRQAESNSGIKSENLDSLPTRQKTREEQGISDVCVLKGVGDLGRGTISLLERNAPD